MAQDRHVTRRIAEFAVGLEFEQLSADAVTAAKRFLLDSVACAFGGYRTVLAAIDPLPGSHELDLLDGAVLAASRCVATACGSTVRAVEGFPAWSVIDAAADREADLVVVAAARQHGFAAAVAANTAELVAGELACDVLIVPVAEDTPARAAYAQR